MTPSYLDALKTLLTVAQDTATLIEQDFSPQVMSRKRIAAHHSPTPWANVQHYYMGEAGCDMSLLNALLVRARLADVIETLQALIVHAEGEEKPINLTLKKTRHVEP